ncbi:MAG: regulatory protein RecX [Magnetovibrio sp.]|nr:regulatory protein RecX [Magnetovibrio sp.]
MEERKPKSKKEPRPPRKITPERLNNIALHHLDRYASSAENLRRVLGRRVYKAAIFHEDLDQAQAQGWIDELVDRFVASGLLNDFAYAETRARAMMSRGSSSRMIRMKLMEKGIAPDTLDAALQALTVDAPDPELFAAIKLARRRRFGPWCDPAKREECQDKHMAAMARSGFSYDMAQRVIQAASPEELEDLLTSG